MFKKDIEYLKILLPSDYVFTSVKKGVLCTSFKGEGIIDGRHWLCVFQNFTAKFDDRFIEVSHEYQIPNHKSFTIYLHPRIK